MSTPGLFGILQQIAEATDEATALTIAKEFGGGKCYIPANPKPSSTSPIVKLIGVDKTKRIVDCIGGGQTDIPQCGVTGSTARQRQAAQLIREGKTQSYVRKVTGYSERNIRRLGKKKVEMSETPLLDFLEKD